MIEEDKNNSFYEKVANIITAAKSEFVQAANFAMVNAYYEIGRLIAERELEGSYRAPYGKKIIKNLSDRLTQEFGRGYSVENLMLMKRFYQTYSDRKLVQLDSQLPVASQTPEPRQFCLSFSHYVFLMRILDPMERSFYEIEAYQNRWSLAELKRQFDTSLYERLALSRDKEGVLRLAMEGQVVETPRDLVKDRYVLEFIGFPELAVYTENDLETELIDHIQEFMMELGKGFTFAGRQVRLSFGDEQYYVDLVFYNRILKCFVLIDLKIGTLKHQDIGQMQMYVNYYDRIVKMPDENKTIGILLCKTKNDAVVEMTLPEGNDQIFSGQYMTVLPSKEELRKLLDEKK